MDDLLNIKNLNVSFAETVAVKNVSLQIRAGEILALVGESGSGKSVTAQSILRLNVTAQVTADELSLSGQDVLSISEKEMDQLRGGIVSMVFQDPMTCLNPTMKVGKQITERLYRKEGMSRTQCKQEAIRLLEQVRISDAALRAEQYPHQLSGGMRQRVMIAMALACRPQLLIADEPTTALDVTTQLQILKLLAQIRKETGTAILLITHDLGVVANLADRVAVMHAGRVVEEGDVTSLFEQASHPYTKALLADLKQEKELATLFPVWDNDGTVVGCPLVGTCQDGLRICLRKEPPMIQIGIEHFVACWRLHNKASEEKTNGEIT